MADSPYALSGAAINSIESPRDGNTFEATGLAGLRDPLSQLSLDLITTSLDISLLLAEQEKLVDALISLNVTLSSQRAFAPMSVAGVAEPDESHSLSAVRSTTELHEWEVVDRSQLQHPDKKQLQMAVVDQSQVTRQKTATFTERTVGPQYERDTAALASAPGMDRVGAGNRVESTLLVVRTADVASVTPAAADAGRLTLHSFEPAQKPLSLKPALAGEDALAASAPPAKAATKATADNPATPSKADVTVYDGSLSRLSTAQSSVLAPVSGIAAGAINSLADGLSWLAEHSPKVAAALGLVGAALTSLGVGLLKAGLDAVLTRNATKLLKLGAARLPPSVGDLIADVDKGGTKNRGKNKAKGTTGRKGKQPGLRAARTSAPRPALPSRLNTSVAVAKSVSKRFAPLTLLTAGFDGVKALMAGDYKAAAGAAGSGVGGLAGGYAGAATGALIGSVIPIVGTAVGGLIGGLVGSYFGSSVGEEAGESLYNSADRLSSPEQISKDLINNPASNLTSNQVSNQQGSITANIYINGQDQASASQLANLVVQQITGQFGLMNMSNPLAVRSDAALTDGGS